MIEAIKMPGMSYGSKIDAPHIMRTNLINVMHGEDVHA
jgi:hypothetical protein